MRTYSECPQRWKFLYVDKLPEAPRGYFSFGRTIHAVLEAMVRPFVVPQARKTPSGRQRVLEDFPGVGVKAGPSTGPAREVDIGAARALLDQLWSSEGYTSAEEEARYRQLGAEILARFWASVRADPPTPVAVEEHLEATWDGVPVHGYIDRVDRTPRGGLEVVDYKTSRELTTADARDSDQLGLYQVLVRENFSDTVEGLTLYHLRSLTPLRSAPRAPAALDALYGRVTTVRDGIRSEQYPPTPGRQCPRCDFRGICPEFKEVPDADRQRLFGHDCRVDDAGTRPVIGLVDVDEVVVPDGLWRGRDEEFVAMRDAAWPAEREQQT